MNSLRLYREDSVLEVSSTYQEVIRVGAVRAVRQVLLNQGRMKFGRASRLIQRRPAAVEDRDHLAALARRLLKVESWEELLKGVTAEPCIEESNLYKAILRTGEIRGLHEMIYRQGQHKFGKPGRKIVTWLEQIEDAEQLKAIGNRLIQANNWDELLGSD
jgi:hypothetical protein